MKRLKKNWGKLLLAGAFLLVAFALWFTRPMTLGTMFSGFDPTGVSKMNGWYIHIWVDIGDVGSEAWRLEDGTSLDEESRALLQALSEAKFRRDVPDNLYMLFNDQWPAKHDVTSNDWLRISFYAGGDMLDLDLNLGRLSFTYYSAEYPNRPEQKWYCSLAGHEELFDSLCAYIKVHGAPQQ